MLPLSDGLHPRRFPFVNVLLIAANLAVWILYEIPHLKSAVYHASSIPAPSTAAATRPNRGGSAGLRPCSCTEAGTTSSATCSFWPSSARTSRTHFGHLRYLDFYIAGGFVATMTQAVVTLLFGSASAAHVPTLGASGAIAAVLGAFIVLYPTARIRTLVLVFLVQIPAWVYLGGWFLYQLVEAHLGLASAAANGGGVAFFAHVGGFAFGAAVTAALLSAGRVVPQSLVRRPALAPY